MDPTLFCHILPDALVQLTVSLCVFGHTSTIIIIIIMAHHFLGEVHESWPGVLLWIKSSVSMTPKPGLESWTAHIPGSWSPGLPHEAE